MNYERRPSQRCVGLNPLTVNILLRKHHTLARTCSWQLWWRLACSVSTIPFNVEDSPTQYMLLQVCQERQYRLQPPSLVVSQRRVHVKLHLPSSNKTHQYWKLKYWKNAQSVHLSRLRQLHYFLPSLDWLKNDIPERPPSDSPRSRWWKHSSQASRRRDEERSGTSSLPKRRSGSPEHRFNPSTTFEKVMLY